MGDRVDEVLEIELSNGDGVLELDILGTLRNYDGDGKENVKKNNRFNEQNNNSARASRFFVHFFAFTAQLRREMTKF